MLKFLLIAVSIQTVVVFLMKALKQKQPIYALSPQSHQGKSGTPTMGGLGILGSVWAGLLYFRLYQPELLWSAGVFTAFCGIGILDDVLSLRKKTNGGLKARQKFLLQLVAGIVAISIFHFGIRIQERQHHLFLDN